MWPPTSTTASPLQRLVNPVNRRALCKINLKINNKKTISFLKKFERSDGKETYCRRTHDRTVAVNPEVNADDLMSFDLLKYCFVLVYLNNLRGKGRSLYFFSDRGSWAERMRYTIIIYKRLSIYGDVLLN